MKTGGMAIWHAVTARGTEAFDVFIDEQKQNKWHHVHVGMPHLELIQEVVATGGKFVVTIRDPRRRMISLFNYKRVNWISWACSDTKGIAADPEWFVKDFEFCKLNYGHYMGFAPWDYNKLIKNNIEYYIHTGTLKTLYNGVGDIESIVIPAILQNVPKENLIIIDFDNLEEHVNNKLDLNNPLERLNETRTNYCTLASWDALSDAHKNKMTALFREEIKWYEALKALS